MDICDSFSDACSPVDLAPCPPPDIDPHMFNDHLTARNLTRQVVLHIAERCGISVIPPTSTDRTTLNTLSSTELNWTTQTYSTTRQSYSTNQTYSTTKQIELTNQTDSTTRQTFNDSSNITTLLNNPTFLILVCAGIMLVAFIICIIVLRKKSCHRSNQRKYQVSLTAENKPVGRKEDSSAGTKGNELTCTYQESTVIGININVIVNENIKETKSANQNGNIMTVQIESNTTLNSDSNENSMESTWL
ncbi:uncharacterized protein LOC128209999 [Mya arenaria]|uniref:uncharacterized protein LOC128209999 n=1 Tax=Mya arenaria TaxID=6604 RepID=UPI0022E55DC9|nr:uncharacterized protein LOC128209999 [Mya arenaria]